jgi:cysteine desulfurase
MERLFFDDNSTSRPLDGALDAFVQCAQQAWANASSVHHEGRLARRSLENSREIVANALGARPRDTTFVSGGTEANNIAIRSRFADDAGTLIANPIDHPSITNVAKYLQSRGVRVHWLALRPSGRIDVDALGSALAENPDARLVVVSLVHHELGCIQPLESIHSLCKSRGVAVHVDAISAIGKVSPPGSHWLSHADSVAIAAHKIGAIAGIGAVAVRRGYELSPVVVGGSQERGIRAGTPMTALAAAFAFAASKVGESLWAYRAIGPLRDWLQNGLVRAGARVNGIEDSSVDSENLATDRTRAPHVCHVSFGDIRGAEWVAALDVEGLSVSSGAACSAGIAGPSESMTLLFPADRARAAGAVRLSLPKTTTESEVHRALECFEKVLQRRGPAGAR